MNTIIYQAIEALENGLLSIPPKQLGFARDRSSNTKSIPDADGDGNLEYLEATTELENGVHQLETLLESTVDKSFDKFEIYTLRNILTIPDDLAPWMRLAHYEVCQLLFEHCHIDECQIIQLNAFNRTSSSHFHLPPQHPSPFSYSGANSKRRAS